jgi:methyl-accepting chemotaxis protein
MFFISIFSINKPLKKISDFAQKIKAGDIGISSSTQSSIDVHSRDEIGVMARVLEDAYNQLRCYVEEIRDRMQSLADGDLITESSDIFQGDFILVKNSIDEILHSLNHLMSEVSASATQVSSASKQLADGAQSLAQGSTEQATAIEQLSASISEIKEKTLKNVEVARKASELSVSIRDNAELGSTQMVEMVNAVKEINDASNQISKVIKVIDDIAFQTNILALNAAVEAARAGQHGKGFAVVAEEVRNLATKSADAAKDTGGLIENSIEKANLGLDIATKTSSSLNDIVDGINESAEIVNQIAQSSDEQASSISHINTGIDQVASVVQQNNATAQESAAASEEMSSQSLLLQQIISHFKINTEDGDVLKLVTPKIIH